MNTVYHKRKRVEQPNHSLLERAAIALAMTSASEVFGKESGRPRLDYVKEKMDLFIRSNKNKIWAL